MQFTPHIHVCVVACFQQSARGQTSKRLVVPKRNIAQLHTIRQQTAAPRTRSAKIKGHGESTQPVHVLLPYIGIEHPFQLMYFPPKTHTHSTPLYFTFLSIVVRQTRWFCQPPVPMEPRFVSRLPPFRCVIQSLIEATVGDPINISVFQR